MDSREIIRLIEAAGWELKGVRGSHHQFVRPGTPGKVTVAHPRKDMPIGTVRKIEAQSGVKLIRR